MDRLAALAEYLTAFLRSVRFSLPAHGATTVDSPGRGPAGGGLLELPPLWAVGLGWLLLASLVISCVMLYRLEQKGWS